MPEAAASLPPATARASSAGTRDLRVPAGAASQRVDRFLADVTGLSRSHVQKLISAGNLTSDGVALKANAVVTPGTSLRLVVPEPEPLDLAPAPDIELQIVHEDADLLIVDKPAGLVVHPAPGHSDDTLVNALLARGGAESFGGIAGVRRPGIVHRLDRDTSGLLMVARTDAAQHSLMAQLKARRVKKTYLALVLGEVAAAVGRIEAPIGRDPRHRTRMGVVADGRPATTGYRVRERFHGWTLLELDLVTGRTHQIRVHLDAIGHPIAGDALYGTGTSRRGPEARGRGAGGATAAVLERLFLHSWRLELTSPSSGELIRAEAPLPDELERVLDGLRDERDSAGRR
jgi:23S rRNA pseudouridine1911/1915/1917 synthase